MTGPSEKDRQEELEQLTRLYRKLAPNARNGHWERMMQLITRQGGHDDRGTT